MRANNSTTESIVTWIQRWNSSSSSVAAAAAPVVGFSSRGGGSRPQQSTPKFRTTTSSSLVRLSSAKVTNPPDNIRVFASAFPYHQHPNTARWTQENRRFLSSSASQKAQQQEDNDVDVGDSRQTLSSYLANTAQIDTSLHDGMFRALESVYGKNLSQTNLESFGVEGLRALAASVEQQQLKHNQTPRPSRNVTFEVPHHRTSFEVQWHKGDSLLDVAKQNGELLGEYMEGTCGGQMSCCTCHVYVDDATLSKLPKPSRAENDMLDIAFEPRSNSRLGCQVELRNELLEQEEDVVITLPSNVNNVWK